MSSLWMCTRCSLLFESILRMLGSGQWRRPVLACGAWAAFFFGRHIRCRPRKIASPATFIISAIPCRAAKMSILRVSAQEDTVGENTPTLESPILTLPFLSTAGVRQAREAIRTSVVVNPSPTRGFFRSYHALGAILLPALAAFLGSQCRTWRRDERTQHERIAMER
ncbi:hypothetical protein OH76DRAFT_938350 [Lentinus brumalis]|uniref:Uncharacterized protein n=1 Tax=Lentinus brumalis TaxID=2498619 RepID=A0A371CZE5_9APHY|nr:hypothetical protein OH76DRAFT_938350 [Polyporus brumalis]